MNASTQVSHRAHVAACRNVADITAALRQIIASSVAGEVADEVVLKMVGAIDQIDEACNAMQTDVERARLDNFREWVEESLLADDGRKQAQLLELAQSLAAKLPQNEVDQVLSEVYIADEQHMTLASLLQVEDPEIAGPSFCEVAEDIESLAEFRLQTGQCGFGSLQIAASTMRAMARHRTSVDRLCALAAGLRTATVTELPFLSEQFRVTAAASIFQPQAHAGG